MKPPALFLRFTDWTLRHKRVARPIFVLVFLSLVSAFVLYTVKIGSRMLRTGKLLPCFSGDCAGCQDGAARKTYAFPELPTPPRPKK